MLNISENSWYHREIVMRFRETPPRSLCTYFWTFVFSGLLMIVFSVFVAALLTLAAGVALDPVLTYGIAWWMDINPTHSFIFNDDLSKEVTFVGAYTIYTLSIVIGGVYVVFEKTNMGETLFTKMEGRSRARRKALADGASLNAWEMFWKGLGSLKSKVCPRINYKW